MTQYIVYMDGYCTIEKNIHSVENEPGKQSYFLRVKYMSFSSVCVTVLLNNEQIDFVLVSAMYSGIQLSTLLIFRDANVCIPRSLPNFGAIDIHFRR